MTRFLHNSMRSNLSNICETITEDTLNHILTYLVSVKVFNKVNMSKVLAEDILYTKNQELFNQLYRRSTEDIEQFLYILKKKGNYAECLLAAKIIEHGYED